MRARARDACVMSCTYIRAARFIIPARARYVEHLDQWYTRFVNKRIFIYYYFFLRQKTIEPTSQSSKLWHGCIVKNEKNRSNFLPHITRVTHSNSLEYEHYVRAIYSGTEHSGVHCGLHLPTKKPHKSLKIQFKIQFRNFTLSFLYLISP